jgi:hypothetical protein
VTYCARGPFEALEAKARERLPDLGVVEHGFLTEAGDFLDRYEAADYALACGQVESQSYGVDYVNSGLSPEDLGWS